MSYDRQVIIQFDDDPLFEAGASDLSKRCIRRGMPSRIVRMLHWSRSQNWNVFRREDTDILTNAFQDLTNRSRVYLLAHGDWQTRTLDAHDAQTISYLLGSCGMPEVKILSVLGCELARDRNSASNVKVTNSIDSFAGKLHRLLAQQFRIKVDLYARVDSVGILTSDGTEDDKYGGRKVTVNEAGKPALHAQKSKLKFWWDGSTQKRSWAY